MRIFLCATKDFLILSVVEGRKMPLQRHPRFSGAKPPPLSRRKPRM